MGNLNEAYEAASSGNVIMPKCRIVYKPAFFEATQIKQQGKAKYRGTFLIPKAANIDYLKKRIADCAKENLGSKKVNWANPLLKTADDARLEDYADEFPYMIRPNTDNRPDVLLATMAVVDSADEPDECYSGRWARPSLSVYWYKDKPGTGVGLGLSNVQLLEHGESIAVGGGRTKAENDFESVDEGDLADMES